VSVEATRLVVAEGSYAMHPAFAEWTDLSVFLDVSPDEQRRRILRRNGEAAETFFSRWIPLEEAYIAATDPISRCDLYIRNDAEVL
jgi:hypothetical protein